MKMFAIRLSLLASLLLLAACSVIDPVDDTESVHERRLIGDAAAVHRLTGDALSTYPGPTAARSLDVRLQEGQSIAFPDHDATLTFIEKTEDSRCAANVICVWEGEATILLAFARSSQEPVSFEMGGFVGPDGNRRHGQGLIHEAFGLRFTLLRLDPYPLVDVVQTDPVAATIRVEAL